MKAFIYSSKSFFSKTEFAFVDDLKVPSPTRKGDLLVKVSGVTINPIDYKLCGFPFVSTYLRGRPVAMDFCGTVVSTFEGSRFKRGDQVFGSTFSGTLAEYTLASEDKVALKPEKLSPEATAGLVCAGLTSYQSLFTTGGLQAGQNVTIIGGSGGCGSLAIQMAKAAGAGKISTVCSSRNVQMVKDLGADVVVTYDTQPEGWALSSFIDPKSQHLVYDTVTSPDDFNYEPLARPVLQDQALYVGINSPNAIDWIRAVTRMPRTSHRLVMMDANSKDLEQLAKWADEGKLTVPVEETLTFSEDACRSAFEKLKSRRTKGKICIVMPENDQ
uniref:Enoyl reductase (ER) domain-containing protein n=1 Tax=Chromera velia CCMP2878 TaxID=1169474 RepID=A0A0G4GVU8_9ALVE|eukprot:Cvel_23603.t1-p1 / transcript=Cvel_23603.t1 / gene=Cvel_23603 / organism=Chromera_velia_CCMP2878 / gene_product=Putative quinone-oxidoreductase homolog,, putative / transcript_product=Putative quinone-oxidoreductase homolog,, putative / location=Cvel_scaffold2451:1429-2754(-) / protein_length=328 / sequence_SO=supercontig / SO=protein_coding / is_pseudo=false